MKWYYCSCWIIKICISLISPFLISVPWSASKSPRQRRNKLSLPRSFIRNLEIFPGLPASQALKVPFGHCTTLLGPSITRCPPTDVCLLMYARVNVSASVRLYFLIDRNARVVEINNNVELARRMLTEKSVDVKFVLEKPKVKNKLIE